MTPSGPREPTARAAAPLTSPTSPGTTPRCHGKEAQMRTEIGGASSHENSPEPRRTDRLRPSQLGNSGFDVGQRARVCCYTSDGSLCSPPGITSLPRSTSCCAVAPIHMPNVPRGHLIRCAAARKDILCMKGPDAVMIPRNEVSTNTCSS
ncbi:hypothetical protein EJ04DRAFT_234671 [Polyplosphaeria fusca]|uniref:Uncharacterized protein n=1 Tax=Polyplosphaeria fusca TaxID=682080 RepID=A0A9P4V961_9PLEO|nr:hypothetical protein EJ04DRAFT_234671 [Polyplosphaeria fusca]